MVAANALMGFIINLFQLDLREDGLEMLYCPHQFLDLSPMPKDLYIEAVDLLLISIYRRLDGRIVACIDSQARSSQPNGAVTTWPSCPDTPQRLPCL